MYLFSVVEFESCSSSLFLRLKHRFFPRFWVLTAARISSVRHWSTSAFLLVYFGIWQKRLYLHCSSHRKVEDETVTTHWEAAVRLGDSRTCWDQCETSSRVLILFSCLSVMLLPHHVKLFFCPIKNTQILEHEFKCHLHFVWTEISELFFSSRFSPFSLNYFLIRSVMFQLKHPHMWIGGVLSGSFPLLVGRMLLSAETRPAEWMSGSVS